MADELARWAADRAPRLLARAEQEAVAMLRDALVAAATRQRTPRRDEPKPEPAASSPAPAELLWTYCVLRAGDPQPERAPGVDASAAVERVEAAGLAALVSRVPGAQFAAESLQRNLNDIEWLERVARAHEAVLERALMTSTIVPLRLCTLYESDESVRQMLEREHDSLVDALEALDGRQEWGVKLLIDESRLKDEARARSGEPAALEDDQPEAPSAGGAYLLRRRAEREVRELADGLAAEVAEDVHARLQDWALDAVTRPPQNRDLSGHEGEMLLNAAYLVETDRVDGLRKLVADLEARHRGLGAHIELTGPWPPYNFVPGGGAAAIT